MNFKTLCQLHHCERRWILLHPTYVPHVRRNEPFLRPRVRFLLLGIASHPFHVTERQVIDKGLVASIRHVMADMCELVKQAEPEIIQSVVTKRETNNRAAVRKLECRAVQMRVRQML